MFKRIRKIFELSKKLESFEPYETNSSGDRLIRLHVNDLDYFLSPLSVDGVPVISDETAYLLNFYLKNMSVDGDEKLCFEVTAPDITENEQSIYRKAIKNYYREEFIDVQIKFRENLKKTITMLGVGLLPLFLKIFLHLFVGLGNEFTEIINIAAWVFLWEAVDLFFIKRVELRKVQLRNLKILEAQFSFRQKVLPEDTL